MPGKKYKSKSPKRSKSKSPKAKGMPKIISRAIILDELKKEHEKKERAKKAEKLSKKKM